MKYRLIDLICCPYDGMYPLELVTEERYIASSAEVRHKIDSPQCELYCSYHGYPISGDGGSCDYRCNECLGLSIKGGCLRCGKCKRSYPIIDGIVSVLPDEMKESNGDFNKFLGVSEEHIDFFSNTTLDQSADSLSKKDGYKTIFEKQTRDIEAKEAIKRNPDQQYLKDIEIESVKKRIERLHKKDIILDVGVGNGETSLNMLEYFREVVVSDFSLKTLKLAEKLFIKNGRTNFYPVQMDACNIPFRQNSFDMVTSMMTLNHFPGPKLIDIALHGFRCVLKRDGETIITVYNDHITKKIHRWLKVGDFASYALKEGFHSTGIYYRNFSYNELKDAMEKHFLIEEINGIAPVIPKITKFSKNHQKIGVPLLSLLEKTKISVLFGNILIGRGRKNDA